MRWSGTNGDFTLRQNRVDESASAGSEQRDSMETPGGRSLIQMSQTTSASRA
ncbi:uncharacterized protein V6R79_004765 [Siganus canaliculatus]